MMLKGAILALLLTPLCSVAAPSDWDYSLSLSPNRSAPQPIFKMILPDELASLPTPEPLVDPRKEADLAGVDVSPVYTTDASTVEYRTGLGIGAGFATNAALAVSQTLPVANGLDLSVYYLRSVGEPPGIGGHHVGAETDPASLGNVAGFRLEWKF